MTKKNLLETVEKQVANQETKKPASKADSIRVALEKMTSQFAAALPKHITPERLTRIALTTIRTNPKLMNCSMPSLLGAVMQAAQLGLEPNIMGQCYIIPYGSEAQFQVGYLGLVELFYRTGVGQSLTREVVFENDEFEYELGLDMKLRHKPAMKDRGKAIGYYAIARLNNGGLNFAFMSVDDIEQHAKKYSKAYSYSSSPWKSDFDAMAKKTVLKKVLKFMPKSVEIISTLQADEKSLNFEKTFEDNPIVYEDGEMVDIATGEVLEDDK